MNTPKLIPGEIEARRAAHAGDIIGAIRALRSADVSLSLKQASDIVRNDWGYYPQPLMIGSIQISQLARWIEQSAPVPNLQHHWANGCNSAREYIARRVVETIDSKTEARAFWTACGFSGEPY